MKIGIIGGAGALGSTTAFRVALLGIVEEIVLIDIKENLVKSHEMDMGQAISEYNQTKISAGIWSDLQGCDVVVFCASMPEVQCQSRVAYLEANLKIVNSVCKHVKELCPDTIIINATNPVDVINLAIQQVTGIKPNKIIGFSRNDTLRLRWAIAKVIGKNTQDISAICLGEHGEKQVPIFSRVFINGEPYEMTDEQKEKVVYETSNWFINYQALNSGRTSGWTSALGLAKLIQCIATDSDEIVPCSVILNGEYGINDVSLGVPVQLGKSGIEKIIELPLIVNEIRGLSEAANKIKALRTEFKL